MDRTERQALLRAENIALAAKVKKSVLSKFMYNGASLSDDEIEKAIADGYLEKLSPKSAIAFINEKAQLNIQKNRRNGRAQKEHLEIARCIQALQNKKNGTDWRDGSGRKPKQDVVRAWRAANPTGCKADCIRDTGLTKPTVYKWWDAPC